MTPAFTPPPSDTTRPTLRGSFGMAASTHWLATAAAQSVLERGGNAFDAAVAAGFVLHVVEPHLNGPGGDMVALIAEAGAEPIVVVGQGVAPAAATIEHFRAEGLDAVPGAGALAAAVPGTVLAWFDLLADRGTWELADVLQSAIHYAEHGHPISAPAAAVIARMAPMFREHWPASAELWLRDGESPAAGDTVRNPTYARTLRRLIEAGTDAAGRVERIAAAREAWKRGFVAEAMVRTAGAAHRHSSGTDHRGVLTPDDLADWAPTTERPLTVEFRGVTVAKAGAWTQGPVTLQTLAMLEHLDDARLDPSTALGIHTIAEAMKLALADRDAHYGDREDVPMDLLLSPEYARQRAALIGETASSEIRPGDAGGGTPWMPPLIVASSAAAVDIVPGTGEPTVRPTGETRGDTCHLDVADRFGNLVSATPSGGWLQSSPTIPELGFCLGTRLQMTWLDAASPSALVPGRRPRTTLSPTMVRVGSETVAALGTPGGDQQDQWQLLYLLRTIVGGYTPQQAIDAPAFHTTSLVSSFWPREFDPAGLVVEGRVGDAVMEELRGLGHRVTVAGDWTLGRLSAVTRDPATGDLAAAANSRGEQGYAAGR